jgi:ATP-dependent RNA helicase RhlE
VCVDELKLLKDIERLVKRDIPRVVIGDFEPDPSIKAQPVTTGRGKQQKAPGHKPGKSAGSNQAARNDSNRKSAKPWNKQRPAGNKGRPNNQSPPRKRARRGSRNAA